jgi:ribonuclease BN (tRNA processing enzyme)
MVSPWGEESALVECYGLVPGTGPHLAGFQVATALGEHSVPVCALRFTDLHTAASICYSGDGRPSRTVEELARGTTLLVHEANDANGDPPSLHSQPADALALARRSGVNQVVLMHLTARSARDARHIDAGGHPEILPVKDHDRVTWDDTRRRFTASSRARGG